MSHKTDSRVWNMPSNVALQEFNLLNISKRKFKGDLVVIFQYLHGQRIPHFLVCNMPQNIIWTLFLKGKIKKSFLVVSNRVSAAGEMSLLIFLLPVDPCRVNFQFYPDWQKLCLL